MVGGGLGALLLARKRTQWKQLKSIFRVQKHSINLPQGSLSKNNCVVNRAARRRGRLGAVLLCQLTLPGSRPTPWDIARGNVNRKRCAWVMLWYPERNKGTPGAH